MVAVTANRGQELDAVSDMIDEVNVLKGMLKGDAAAFDEASKFDEGKEKETFRNYEDAKDHVKVSFAAPPHIASFPSPRKPPEPFPRPRSHSFRSLTFSDRCFTRSLQKFYAEQHAKQTLEYNLKAREKFHNEKRASMTIWEAIEKLDTLVDESDPDTELSQIQHLLQTAEAMRRDGKPDWMQLTGLVHDLGKLLFFYGAEGQWDVVGDTFVVGCKFSDKIIYPSTCK
jgi:inositol oxygenase